MILRASYEDGLGNSDIKGMERYFYIFVDRNMMNTRLYDKHAVIEALVIQVNISYQNGRDVTENLYRINDSSVITKNVYAWNGYFPDGVENFQTGELRLINGTSIRLINNYDLQRSRHLNPGFYSNLINSNSPDKNLFDYELANCLSSLPYPEYYTKEHQISVTSEYVDLIDYNNYTMIKTGAELIDNHTKNLTVLDIKAWDTLIPEIVDEIMNRQVDENDVMHIPCSGFIGSANNLLSDITYIYDSDLGVNFTSGHIPFSKLVVPTSLGAYFEDFNLKMQNEFKKLEKIHGNIRVHYSAKDRGDRMAIYCKDYNSDSQPILTPKISDNSMNFDKNNIFDVIINEVISENNSNAIGDFVPTMRFS